MNIIATLVGRYLPYRHTNHIIRYSIRVQVYMCICTTASRNQTEPNLTYQTTTEFGHALLSILEHLPGIDPLHSTPFGLGFGFFPPNSLSFPCLPFRCFHCPGYRLQLFFRSSHLVIAGKEQEKTFNWDALFHCWAPSAPGAS